MLSILFVFVYSGWSLACHPPSPGYFEKIDVLANRKLTSYILTTAPETLNLQCAEICASLVMCSCFSHAKKSGDCMMSSIRNATLNDTEPAEEPTEFYKKEKSCPLMPNSGFHYDPASDMCFKISEELVPSWEAAVQTCRAENLELIILNTPKRQAAVMHALAESPKTPGDYLYIGAARPKAWWGNTTLPDRYYWLDGSPVVWHDSPYWGTSPLQPNGYGTEECLAIYRQDLVIYDRKTTDDSRYICQLS